LIAFHTVTPAHKMGAATARSRPLGRGVRWRVKETAYLREEQNERENELSGREDDALLEGVVLGVTGNLSEGASCRLSTTVTGRK
jgi:hypothetical protein